MSRRVTAHHFVANLTTRQYGRHPTSDLLGVDYFRTVPADTEFPRSLGTLDLFARFYLRRARPEEFLIRIRWLDSPGRRNRLIGEYSPYPVLFRPDEQVRDVSFRVFNVVTQGVGVHAVRLLRPRRQVGREKRFVIVAETHFLVEK